MINKYVNHPSRYLFSCSDIYKHCEDFSVYYNQLFEYNKVYLSFSGSVSGFRFQKNYFFKGINRALYLNESLNADERTSEDNDEFLTRKQLEHRLDVNQFDAMYLIDRNGSIIYAKNKKDGTVISRNIIPSDREIIEKEKEHRISKHDLAIFVNEKIDTEENKKQANISKNIEEIKNFNIYGPLLFAKYSHFLVTVKNGNFDVKFFKLDFVCNSIFKLTTSTILVVEPTVDDVINYSRSNEIDEILEPTVYGASEVMKRVKKLKTSLSNK